MSEIPKLVPPAPAAKFYVTRMFPKELLQDILWNGAKKRGFTRIDTEVIDQRRWVTVHRCLFREDATGKFYETVYERGSTEYQDTSPYDDVADGDEIDCTEMHEVEVLVKQFKAVEVVV